MTSSPLHTDDQSSNFPRNRATQPPFVANALPVYVTPDDRLENLQNNVPRRPRSSLLPKQSKSTRNEADQLKEISTVTKILVATSFAAILIPQMTTDSISRIVEIILLWLAILAMIVRLYVQGKMPKLSCWLQRIGHLSCLAGLMVMQSVMLQLPLIYVLALPVTVALIVGAAIFYSIAPTRRSTESLSSRADTISFSS